MSEENNEKDELRLHTKAFNKVKNVVLEFIKHPFTTAADVVFYAISLTVALWLIFSVVVLCWNILRPFIHHQW